MATTWKNEYIPGQGWTYNDADLTYNDDYDENGNAVYYNAVGVATTWTEEDEV